MSFKILYRAAINAKVKSKSDYLYDLETGLIISRKLEHISGSPCASPIDFNRKIKRARLKVKK